MSGWALQPIGFTPPAQLLHSAKAGVFLDPAELSAAPSFTSGTIIATAMMVFSPGVASNLVMRIATALVTPTAGQNLVGVYSADGSTQYGLSGDQSAAWGSTGNVVMTPASGTFQLTGSFVWVLILCVAVTPIAVQSGTAAAAAGLVNVGPTGGLVSPRRSGTAGTGQTALPASFVPGATAANFAPGVFAF
jgi:hypothetical protein